MLKFTRFLLLVTLCLYAPFPVLAGNNAGQAFYTWPDTGQTTCYDDVGNVLNPCPAPGQPFYGQDAQYTGPARSYTKLDSSGNALAANSSSWAMVRDNVTGLAWEAKQAKNGTPNYINPHDADNTYTWCDTNPDTNGGDQGSCVANDTEDFLAALNSGSGFGGHTDWRLPTLKEIDTLVDRDRFSPAISINFFPQTMLSYYWSSTSYANATNSAWRENFYYGFADLNDKSNSHYVRAVRGGKVQPEDRFVDNQDGTVTDTVTCLQWEQETMVPMSWKDALAYAENLTLAGHKDWRLPDINELRYIVDYTRFNPAIDTTAFPGTMSSYYWSSTTIKSQTEFAFAVDFDYGPGLYSKPYSYYVRAVRGGQCGGSGGNDSVTYGIFITGAEGDFFGFYDGIEESVSEGALQLRDSMVKNVDGLEKNNTVLLNTPTINDIKRTIGNFNMKSGDRLIFYYTGHGGESIQSEHQGELSASTADEYLVINKNEALFDDELYSILNQLRNGIAKLIILDACHSGGFWSDKPEDGGDLNLLSDIMTITAAKETSGTFALLGILKPKMGYLTYAILDGLKFSYGYSKADTNKDSSISLNEWNNYLDNTDNLFFEGEAYELSHGDIISYTHGSLNFNVSSSLDYSWEMKITQKSILKFMPAILSGKNPDR